MGQRTYTDFEEWPELTVNPATPSSGWTRVFTRDGIGFMSIDDAGVVHILSYSIERIDAGIKGTLATGVGTHKFYLSGGGTFTLDSMTIAVGTAPTGASLIVDVNYNGTTIYTTQSNRPTIAASGTNASGNSPQVTSYASGGYFTFDVDQIGSTVAGADLVCSLRLRKVA